MLRVGPNNQTKIGNICREGLSENRLVQYWLPLLCMDMMSILTFCRTFPSS